MKISIIGSGSWGTALAQVAKDNKHDVVLWGIDEKEVMDINEQHQNSKYFPEVQLNPELKATLELSEIKGSDLILLAVPVMALEEVCKNIASYVDKPAIIINVAKGFHPETHERLSVVIRRLLNNDTCKDVVSLIGPSHAEEVVLRLLTTVNAVCENEKSAQIVQEFMSNDYFRVYRGVDVVGSEIGVAIKNVMALASGVLAGVGQGDNARAALMTRGLAEMARFGAHFGAKAETYLGLTGVGDLIVTCTSVHSRNYQAGLAIGKSGSAKAFFESNTKTVEGVKTAKTVYEMAKKHGISMPITEQVYQVLYENKNPKEAIVALMSRNLKSE